MKPKTDYAELAKQALRRSGIAYKETPRHGGQHRGGDPRAGEPDLLTSLGAMELKGTYHGGLNENQFEWFWGNEGLLAFSDSEGRVIIFSVKTRIPSPAPAP